jgi:adenine phosphoribosyltransferase
VSAARGARRRSPGREGAVSGFDLDGAIRKIPDHPTPGILFYDLMPLFADPRGLAACVDAIAGWARERRPDVVLGAEARAFICGGAVARALGAGFVPARKPGRLPGEVVAESYALEYGTDRLEVAAAGLLPGQRVLVHDDLLATGGTAEAVCRLVERLGAEVVGVAFVVELTFLPGRARLAGREVMSLLRYDTERVGP